MSLGCNTAVASFGSVHISSVAFFARRVTLAHENKTGDRFFGFSMISFCIRLLSGGGRVRWEIVRGGG
jgi:hypothetical protein